MLKNILAPYYKFKSITTVLMCINAILYITLVCRFPPFLSIPSFALQPLQLMPEHLRHFEFYRMLTAPFVYKDLSTLLLYTVLVWSLGSYT